MLALLLPALLAADPPRTIDYKAGDELVARLNYGDGIAKPYLWPVHAPGGVPVTRAWPMDKANAKSTDHVHQKSAWFCHGGVIPEGIELKQKIKGVEGVDFWSEHPGHGRISDCEVLPITNLGSPRGVASLWLTHDGAKLLSEMRSFQVHAHDGAFLIEVNLSLTAHVAVTFGDTKEGSFGVRVHDQLAVATGGGTITNADGKTGEKECWGQQSKWCDYSGKVDGKEVGIAIFDHPKNKSPACWHVRGYGLMAANPFGREKSGFPATKGRTDLVKLAKDEMLELRYAILTHTGDAKTGKVAEHYAKWLELTK